MDSRDQRVLEEIDAVANMEAGGSSLTPVPVQVYKNSYASDATSPNKFRNKLRKKKRLSEDEHDGGSFREILLRPVDELLRIVGADPYKWDDMLQNGGYVFVLVLAWYFSAVFAITTSKMIMLNLPLPYTLCTSQFITASLVTLIYGWIWPPPTTNSAGVAALLKMSSNPSDHQLDALNNTHIGGAGIISGHSSSNSNSNSNTSQNRGRGLAQMSSIRDRANSASITTDSFNLNAGMMQNSGGDDTNETKYNTKSRGSLASMLFRCSNKKHGAILYITAFSYTCGFLFTNMAFSVVTASFAETVKSAEPITSVIMAYVVLKEVENVPTYMSLIPICVGVACSCLHDNSFNTFGFACAAFSNICFSTRAVYAKKLMKSFPGAISEVTMFGYVSLIGLCMLIPVATYMEGTKLYAKFVLNMDDSYIGSRSDLLFLAAANGLAYTCYNVMSFLVLTRTNMVTHAILNCIRRVFIIIFTCYFFDIHLTNTNLVGVGIAVAGVITFGYFKNAANLAKKVAV